MKLPRQDLPHPAHGKLSANKHSPFPTHKLWYTGCNSHDEHISRGESNMSDIGNITAAATNNFAAPDTVESAAKRPVGGDLGKDEFMRLLVAQLENQNPLEPLDNAAFIS